MCVISSGLLSRQLVAQERGLLPQLLRLLGVEMREQIRRVHLGLRHQPVAKLVRDLSRRTLRPLADRIVEQPLLPRGKSRAA